MMSDWPGIMHHTDSSDLGLLQFPPSELSYNPKRCAETPSTICQCTVSILRLAVFGAYYLSTATQVATRDPT